MKEDYCSFEISKLLKEKGFDGLCYTYYPRGVKDKYNISMLADNHNKHSETSRPTLQMAMKWLRKKHNIDIEIDANVGMLGIKVYTPFISTYKSVTDNTNKLRQYKRGLHYKDDKGVVPALQHFSTHEEAVEAALKYCLTELI